MRRTGPDGMSHWSVYMVRAADGSLYTGVATDVDRRFEEHSQGGPRAARYLRGRGPLELLYQARLGEQGLALRVEGRLKRLDKSAKEDVVRSRPDPDELLDLLNLSSTEEE
jgi:putative endonuclease